MTKNDKISWLIQHDPELYARAKAEAEQELYDVTPMFCFCGALATGFHTSYCKKFQEQLKTRIVDNLKDALPK